MKLLCHRGWWQRAEDKNSWPALCAAIDAGLGIETDVRDLDGQLVIAHDLPRHAAQPSLDALLAHCAAAAQPVTLALNIKSDGLQLLLQQALARHGLQDYFVFDMSIPDTLGYRSRGMRYAVRLSEYEDGGPLLQDAGTVWLDAFERSDWYDCSLVERLLDQGKTVAVVSPELHRRPPAASWARLKPLAAHPGLQLCTDLVTQAQEFFDGY